MSNSFFGFSKKGDSMFNIFSIWKYIFPLVYNSFHLASGRYEEMDLFGGEGFILQKATGPGIVFLEIDGSVTEYNLDKNEMIKVDTGHIAMYEESVSYELTTVKGVKNVLFSGEGLFLAT